MAYKKFDDPAGKVSQATQRGNEATWDVKMRRALQAISNVVIGSTQGTGGHIITASIGTGGTSGIKINTALVVRINGVHSTCITQDNLWMPNYGTMGTREACKFLVSTGAGTSGTVTGPGNVVNANDYTTDTLALAACKLPELPDGHCAIGYMTLITPAATEVNMSPKALVGLYSTAGTATFNDLVCMPYNG